MAAVLDLAALAQAHEPVPCAARPVAGSAEGRNKAHVHKPGDNLVQAALVGYIELFRIVGPFRFVITAYGGAGCSGNLGNAQMQRPGPDSLAFPGGDDHAGIRHADADQGDEFFENFIGDAVVKHRRIDVVRFFDTGHADGVGPYAMDGFQMLRVHQQARELIAVQLQPEQDSQAHVII